MRAIRSRPRFRRAWSPTASTCPCRKPRSRSGSKRASRNCRSRPARSWEWTAGDSSGARAAWLPRFLAMNEVFGRFFDVDPIEMFEPAAYAQAGAPRDLFVFDDQLHFVRGTRGAVGMGLRSLSQGPSSGAPGNPNNPKESPGRAGQRLGRLESGARRACRTHRTIS